MSHSIDKYANNPIDNQFDKWQQQFHKSTPTVDPKALIMQVTTTHKKEKLKAWIEVVFGLCVSAYCVYVALFIDQNTVVMMLFLGLGPVPIGFAVWAFKLRYKRWQQQTFDVTHLLEIKRQQLNDQIMYWSISFFAVLLLWLCMLIATSVNYMMFDGETKWFALVGVNAFVVLATTARYVYLKRHLQQGLSDIARLGEG